MTGQGISEGLCVYVLEGLEKERAQESERLGSQHQVASALMPPRYQDNTHTHARAHTPWPEVGRAICQEEHGAEE